MDKLLIDALKLEPKSKNELIIVLRNFFPKKTDEALRKRVERGLSKLVALGLVEKRKNKYFWYIYITFLDKNYNVKLEHSQKLIPALRRIAGEFWIKNQEEKQINGLKQINDDSLETHLGVYPEILELREEYQKLKNKTMKEKEDFISLVNEKVKTTFGDKIMETTGLDSGGYVKISLGSLIYKMFMSKESAMTPAEIGGVGNVVTIGVARVSNDITLVDSINEFIKKETIDELNILKITRIEKREEKTKKLWDDFQKRIQELIAKIQSGEPLKANCRTCPEVYDLPDK